MRIPLTLLIILPLTVFSQGNDSTRTGKFFTGLTFSPDYCYRTLKPDASSKWIGDIRDSREIPKFGYTTGLKLSYRHSKKFSFETGLLFSDKGEKTKIIATDRITSNGQPDTLLPTTQIFIYHYYYLDIPVKLNYYFFSTDKGDFYVAASFSLNIFLTQKTNSLSEYGDGHKTTNTSTTSGYSGTNLSFPVGIGYQANFSDRLFFKIEPTYRRSITSIIDAPIKEYLYSAGIDIGLYYRL